MPYPPDPFRERAQDNAIVEPGWQNRIREALNRDGRAREQVEALESILDESRRNRRGISIIQGDIRDVALAARATDRWVTDKGFSATHRQLVVAEQSVDNAIAGAHLVSAAVNPDDVVGGYVGYATGQGQLLGPDTRIGVSAKSNLLQHVLQGRLNRHTVGAFLIDDAESLAVDNQLLIGALRQLHDTGEAPPIMLVSRRPDRAEILAKFFDVDAHSETFDENRSEDDRPVPNDIRYESVKEPHHVKSEIRTAEILSELMGRKTSSSDSSVNAIAFFRDDQTVENAMRELRRKMVAVGQYGTLGKNQNEYAHHRVVLLTHGQSINERLQAQLNKPTGDRFENKGIIVLSSLPADVLGCLAQFGVVVDEHRSSTRGGYYSIDKAEAERRARYAGPDGICYRLTTEQEFTRPRYTQYGSETYTMDSQARTEALRQLDRSGASAATFPWLNEVRADVSETDGWYTADETHTDDGDAWEDDAQVVNTAAPEPIRYTPPVRWQEPEVPPVVAVEAVSHTPIQELARDLDVNEHVAKLVEALRERGSLELGLGIAACVREARIVETDFEAHRKAVIHFNTRSDVLLRLRALADVRSGRLQMRQSRDIGLNEGGLGHLTSLLDRYARKFRVDVSSDKVNRTLREMTEDELSNLLLEVIPDRLTSVTLETSRSDYYLVWCDQRVEISQDLKPGQQSIVDTSIYERDIEEYGPPDPDQHYGYATDEEADAAWDRQTAAHKKTADRLNANRLFYVALATTGAEDQFITTAHPVSTEAVITHLPDLVRRETLPPVLNQKSGAVEQTSRLLVHRGERSSRSVWRVGEKEPTREVYWEAVEETPVSVAKDVAAALLQAESDKVERVIRARAGIAAQLDELQFITQQVLDRSASNHTASQDRLEAIRKLGIRLQSDAAANTLDEIISETDRQAERVTLLVRKASKEAGWTPDWPTRLRELTTGINPALQQHHFAQECITSEATTAEAITAWITDHLRTEQLTRIQRGDEIQLSDLIDDALSALI